MKFNTEDIDGIFIISDLPKILDASNAIEFKTDIAKILENRPKVVIDMSTVAFIDSAGCGAMIATLRMLKGMGGALKIFAVQKQVRSVFELVRMHKIIDILNTREEAVDSF
ncbi:MAG: STAS domain-containing protein [Deltaproteobacteria bacterium]|nr:STAS domain-containing protein [Deltaproteobacteria bacterium]